ncbi:putative Condensin-2 complex subunit G2 [Blattamonas nauphoetae]|uniref:Condensin-2 complex subunit G2 n=1 Tax=Blattamonas nauphoetae TaxID=2049346 RepID=A0ABQ9Y9X9_9EUKA|nr:putative Condensin-2 complex subunit G2 [Blattamonas nauphoetae]
MVLCNSAVLKNVRTILDVFHKRKSDPTVDEMLNRIYAPIIWQSLSAANPQVRLRASVIFYGAFPIHDPTGDLQTKADEIERNITSLSQLLKDEVPAIRGTAAESCGALVSTFWEVLGADQCNIILSALASLMIDASSQHVRICALKGFKRIAEDTPSLHPSIFSLLARSSDACPFPVLPSALLFDKSIKLRLIFTELLLTMSESHIPRLGEVLPLPLLLRALTMNRSNTSIALNLTHILSPSVFPPSSPVPPITHALHLIQEDEQAALVFFLFVPFTNPPNITATLIRQFGQILREALKTSHTQTIIIDRNPQTKKRRRDGTVMIIEEDDQDDLGYFDLIPEMTLEHIRHPHIVGVLLQIISFLTVGLVSQGEVSITHQPKKGKKKEQTSSKMEDILAHVSETFKRDGLLEMMLETVGTLQGEESKNTIEKETTESGIQTRTSVLLCTFILVHNGLIAPHTLSSQTAARLATSLTSLPESQSPAVLTAALLSIGKSVEWNRATDTVLSAINATPTPATGRKLNTPDVRRKDDSVDDASDRLVRPKQKQKTKPKGRPKKRIIDLDDDEEGDVKTDDGKNEEVGVSLSEKSEMNDEVMLIDEEPERIEEKHKKQKKMGYVSIQIDDDESDDSDIPIPLPTKRGGRKEKVAEREKGKGHKESSERARGRKRSAEERENTTGMMVDSTAFGEEKKEEEKSVKHPKKKGGYSVVVNVQGESESDDGW